MRRIETILDGVPLAARLQGRPLRELLPGWARENAAEAFEGGAMERTAWTDPDSGLRVVLEVRRFEAFGAADWYVQFHNAGPGDSPLLEDVQALDAQLDVGDRRVDLSYANGSLCQVDDFLPREVEIGAWFDRTFAPQDGRSSNGLLPFMNLRLAGGGLVMGVGWSGRWAARFQRADGKLRLTVGQHTTRFRLRPGESVRTPRVLLLAWNGEEPMDGQNRLRQLLLSHYLPRVGGQVPAPPVAQCLQFYYYQTGQAGQDFERKALPGAGEIGCDAYWIDACWYGRSGRPWWEEVGSWVEQPDRFPGGIAPIAEEARRRGMKFVLWFEPERVRKDSLLARQRPDLLLASPHDQANLLLNLADERAVAHVADLLSDRIRHIGIDIYRQDFNFDPLPYWQAADEACGPERAGMTENLYVQGLYRLWDELRRRHPDMWIDNCAGGGRRIDLETLSRSLPLWPSDFHDTPGLAAGMNLHVGDQCENAGLARWVPLFGGGLWNFEPYSARGQALGGFMFAMHIPFEHYRRPGEGVFDYAALAARGHTLLDDRFPRDLARAAIAEHHSLQPFVTGNFWPLLPLTVSPHDWCAYQLHRGDLDAGFALFFRRHESPFPSMQAALRQINPSASYRVSLSSDFTPAPDRLMSGRQLQALVVTIDCQPGSLLLRYVREST